MHKYIFTLLLSTLCFVGFAQHKEEAICYSGIPFLATEAQYETELPSSVLIIADHTFDLLPNFINNQLYFLEIRSAAYNFVEYSKALANMNFLINTIKEKHGRGRLIRQTIHKEHFEDKNMATAHTWQVKSKEINVGLKLNSEGYVVAFCRITNPKITKPLVQWRDEERKKEMKTSSGSF